MSQEFWMNFLRLLPPELAHRVTIRLLQAYGALPGGVPPLETGISCLGLPFNHRLGVAAGMDKDAEAYYGLMKLGFGFVEVGTVTPRPQTGNARPRLFRLMEDGAVINRMGFNNRGIDALVRRLKARNHLPRRILGVNIGPNKTSQNRLQDFRDCYSRALPFADYFAINLSSPNTPNLRDLQQGEAMLQLLQGLREARDLHHERSGRRPPVLLKLAPDWDDDKSFRHILDAGVKEGFDGFILSNTTLARPKSLQSADQAQIGGLSGEPLFAPSTLILAKAFRHLQGAVPLVGVGGIASISEAMVKFSAGASLLQVYTGLAFSSKNILAMLSSKSEDARLPKIFFCDSEQQSIGAKADDFRDENAVIMARECQGCAFG